MGIIHAPDQGKDSTATTSLIKATADSNRVFVLTCAANIKSALALKETGAEEVCDPALCEIAGLWVRLDKPARAVVLAAARALAAR